MLTTSLADGWWLLGLFLSWGMLGGVVVRLSHWMIDPRLGRAPTWRTVVLLLASLALYFYSVLRLAGFE